MDYKMRKILRYTLETNSLWMPEGAEILHLDGSGDHASLIVGTDTEDPREPPTMVQRKFVMVAVGAEYDPRTMRCIGGVNLAKRNFLVFEVTNGE